MAKFEEEKALKKYKRDLNSIKRQAVAELKSEVANKLVDSTELLDSIRAVTKSSYGEPYLVQFRFAPQGLFMQLGVSGQFGRIGQSGGSGTIESKTGLKSVNWFDSIYDKYRDMIGDSAETYHTAKVVSVIDFNNGISRYQP